MQTSKTKKQQTQSQTGWLGLFFVLLIVAVGVMWFMHRSINAYWQQTYHMNSPLTQLDKYAWWRQGGDWQIAANEYYEELRNNFDYFDKSWSDIWAQRKYYLAQQKSLSLDSLNKTAPSPSPLHKNELLRKDEKLQKTMSQHTSVQTASIVDKYLKGKESNKENNGVERLKNTITVMTSENKPVTIESIEPLVLETDDLDISNNTEQDALTNHPLTNQVAEDVVEIKAQSLDVRLVKSHSPIAKTSEATRAATEKTAVTKESQREIDTGKTAEVIENTQDTKTKQQVENRAEQEAEQEDSQIAINLRAGDKVFFAGDSLMQGVAPHMQKWLKSKYKINSINLSKQSTGLAYPNFFNWPKTIERELAKNKKITLLIVFLGPNDPWAFPDPAKKGGPYLKFKSKRWEQVYSQRIDRIVQAAQKANVQLMWLGIPYMRKKKLHNQMLYLDKLLENQLKGKALWLPTAKLLSGGRNHYHPNAKVGKKNVRMRSKDGIHFTISGQKHIARYIMKHINFENESVK